MPGIVWQGSQLASLLRQRGFTGVICAFTGGSLEKQRQLSESPYCATPPLSPPRTRPRHAARAVPPAPRCGPARGRSGAASILMMALVPDVLPRPKSNAAPMCPSVDLVLNKGQSLQDLVDSLAHAVTCNRANSSVRPPRQPSADSTAHPAEGWSSAARIPGRIRPTSSSVPPSVEATPTEAPRFASKARVSEPTRLGAERMLKEQVNRLVSLETPNMPPAELHSSSSLLNLAPFDGLPRPSVRRLVDMYFNGLSVAHKASAAPTSAPQQLESLARDVANGSVIASPELQYKLHQLGGSALQAGAAKLGSTAKAIKEARSDAAADAAEAVTQLQDLLNQTRAAFMQIALLQNPDEYSPHEPLMS